MTLPAELVAVIVASDRVSIDRKGRVWSHVGGQVSGTGISYSEADRAAIAAAVAGLTAVGNRQIAVRVDEAERGSSVSVTIDVGRRQLAS